MSEWKARAVGMAGRKSDGEAAGFGAEWPPGKNQKSFSQFLPP